MVFGLLNPVAELAATADIVYPEMGGVKSTDVHLATYRVHSLQVAERSWLTVNRPGFEEAPLLRR